MEQKKKKKKYNNWNHNTTHSHFTPAKKTDPNNKESLKLDYAPSH